ncbi:MAG: HD domain-containing protein [Ilumatobacteraceae bacterium]
MANWGDVIDPGKIDVIARLADVFRRRGSDSYLGETVTMSEHMLQAAALAEDEGADESLIAAALLHDVGHFADELSAYSPSDTIDKRHDIVGAQLLEPYFDQRIVDAVRLHVAAKRYLCATNSEYLSVLSKASVHTLGLQGGPMSPDEIVEFEGYGGSRDAVRIRLWDDRAKVSGVVTPTFEEYLPLLRQVIRIEK